LSTVTSDGTRHVDERLLAEMQTQRAQFAETPAERKLAAAVGRR